MKELIIGIFVVVVSWIFAWGDFGWISENSFLPLWLGFILVVNGISFVVFKRSIMRDMGVNFGWLFLISIPLWWLFEFLNSFVLNWFYIWNKPIGIHHFFVSATLDFATVVPAVMSVAYLFANIVESKRWEFKWLKLNIGRYSLLLLGIASFALVILVPSYAFPLVWLAPLFVLEYASRVLKLPSVSAEIKRGEWSSTVVLALSSLFTGFWWEYWNYFSMPKWIYSVPFVDFWRIFEMPLIGYAGYLPFGILIFSCSVVCLRFIDFYMKVDSNFKIFKI